jgi:hypothetical protein
MLRWLAKPTKMPAVLLWLLLPALLGLIATAVVSMAHLAATNQNFDASKIMTLVPTAGLVTLLFCGWTQVKMDSYYPDEVREAAARRRVLYSRTTGRLAFYLVGFKNYPLARIAVITMWMAAAVGWAFGGWLIWQLVR